MCKFIMNCRFRALLPPRLPSAKMGRKDRAAPAAVPTASMAATNPGQPTVAEIAAKLRLDQRRIVAVFVLGAIPHPPQAVHLLALP